jgi:thiol:disulfide interchange protein
MRRTLSLPWLHEVAALIRFWTWLAGLIGVAALAPALAAPPPVADLVKTELFAEAASIAPGDKLWLDVHVTIAPGWHIYWRNPGDSGLPTEIKWSLPEGFAAGAIEWPIPERFSLGPIGNYGYDGSVDLLVPISAPAALAAGANPHLDATVKYLVCAQICIPGEARLERTLPVGQTSTPDPATAERFAAARRHLPTPASFAARFTAVDHELRLIVPPAALAGLDRPTATFFPDDDNVIDAAAAPRTEPRGDGLELVLARSSAPAASVPATLAGVLALRGADGTERGYTLVAASMLVASAEAGLAAWWQALVFAFIGGLILNLMPCVFPILSLKLLSLAGAPDAVGRRAQGLAYAAGVLLSFAALGGALLVLRAGGAAIGWGFQLQSPIVVGLLAYLMLAMALSLSGVAEFGIGLAGVGGRLAGRGGLAGAFFTGVLASVVATPCTAPFMGAALGFALVAPAPLAVSIFVVLGAGLAAPLVLASLIPGLARLLPRPGTWMELLKQVLAFPLYATVAWLIWVLVQEVGSESALAALFGLVLVGFAVWIYGRTRLATPGTRRIGGGLAVAGLAAAIVTAVMLPRGGVPATAVSAAPDGLSYEKFTPKRLAALTAEHQPVFVNLTAAWCLTCIVNERVTLDREAVKAAFAAHRIVALKGDWTRQDPEIAAFLQSFGRSGVPLYLLYDGNGSAMVLPQILTERGVIDALAKL